VSLAAADRPPDVPWRRHQHGRWRPPAVSCSGRHQAKDVNRSEVGDLDGHYSDLRTSDTAPSYDRAVCMTSINDVISPKFYPEFQALGDSFAVRALQMNLCFNEVKMARHKQSMILSCCSRSGFYTLPITKMALFMNRWHNTK